MYDYSYLNNLLILYMNTNNNSGTPISELDKLDCSLTELLKNYNQLKSANTALTEECTNLKRSYASLNEAHKKVEQRVKKLLERLVALD